MTIINNRKKICSEVPSDKYRDNWDAIFSKQKEVDETFSEDDHQATPVEELQEDNDGHL